MRAENIKQFVTPVDCPGFRLIPLLVGDKGIARTRNWQKMGPRVLRQIYRRFVGGNVAVRLDDLLALDPDGDGATILLGTLELEGKLPPTVSWRSASGRITRLYRPPVGVKVEPIRPASNDLRLELRCGRGRQCLIPPSVVLKEGENGETIAVEYQWINDPWQTPVAVLPLETLEIIQARVKPAEAPTRTPTSKGKSSGKGNGKEEHDGAGVGSGLIYEPGRNDYLFRRGRGLRGKGVDREEIETALQKVNREKCRPPLTEKEVRDIAKSAASYSANARANTFLLRLTYEQVEYVMKAMGGDKEWIKRDLLIETLQAMTGKAGSIINPPVSLPTIKRRLREMVSKRLFSHKPGGWYKLPRRRQIPANAGAKQD